MFRAAAKAVVPAARTAVKHATRRPVVRRMTTEAAESQGGAPSAEELKRVAEFEKFVDHRLADSLKDVNASIKQLEIKVGADIKYIETKFSADIAHLETKVGADIKHIETKFSADIAHLETKVGAALSKHTLGIIGMIAAVGGGGLTLAYRGGLFDRHDHHGQREGQQAPQVFFISESGIRRVATEEGAARLVEHETPRLA